MCVGVRVCVETDWQEEPLADIYLINAGLYIRIRNLNIVTITDNSLLNDAKYFSLS